MSAPERLQDIAVSDNGFVFDPWTGVSFTVNATGLCVLRALKDALGRQEILDRLTAEFERRDGIGGGDGELLRDLDEFVLLLRKNELLPPSWEVPA